ncbi:MAG: hypothetical protein Q9213_002685 [Squamulea squamosa]
MAEIVYTAVTDATDHRGTLFQGARFWLSQKVPQRNRFIEEVKANGGEVTPLEKEADVKIVDHARKQQLPGTYSYRYIEESVRNGALEDLEQYAVGPPVGTIRAIGSVIQPAKSGRTKFTSDDDHQLVNWVNWIEQRGGATSGNEIYKQLEAKNPRHTWQSWRDRWVKTLKDLPRSAFISQDVPPTPPVDQTIEPVRSPRTTEEQNIRRKPFTEDDARELLSLGDDIENIHPDEKQLAWSKWAENHDHPEDHSAEDWQDLWERTIRPIFRSRKAEPAENKSTPHGPTDTVTELHDQSARRRQASLPVRVSPAKEDTKEFTVSRSPSYHPESPSRQFRAPSQEQNLDISATSTTDGTNDARYDARSPIKRKRPTHEDGEEVPSSSPLQPTVSNKRLRRETFPPENMQSPEKSSSKGSAQEIPDTYASGEPGAIDVIEISDGEESQSSDEEGSHLEPSRSPSLELGSSPKEASNQHDHSASKTQAAFLESAPSIVLDLPAPEGGWSDEDENEDESNDDESLAHGVVHQTGTEFDLPATEGGWSDEDEDEDEDEDRIGDVYGKVERNRFCEKGGGDEDEDDAQLDDAHDDGEYHRILEEEGQDETDHEDDIGSSIEADQNFESGSSFDTQKKQLARQMGMRARSSSSTVKSHSSSLALAIAPSRVQPTTQALLTAPTQQPDFSLAEPEGGWDKILSSPPTSPSSHSEPHQLQLTEQQPPLPLSNNNNHESNHAANLDYFITYMVSLGHNEDNILLALRCTNMDRKFSEKALEYMKTHPGEVPVDMKGFWTEDDDEALRGKDGRRIGRLEEKHGRESLEKRWRFWEEYGASEV